MFWLFPFLNSIDYIYTYYYYVLLLLVILYYYDLFLMIALLVPEYKNVHPRPTR